jgi:hypothetical protein
MIVAHIFGIPVEETVVQLAPAGAVAVTAVAVVGRTRLGRLLARIRRHSREAVRSPERRIEVE